VSLVFGVLVYEKKRGHNLPCVSRRKLILIGLWQKKNDYVEPKEKETYHAARIWMKKATRSRGGYKRKERHTIRYHVFME
jgi:hypothetical protein